MIDEDEEADDDDGELVASDLEQMQNLLEFKVKTRWLTSLCVICVETPRLKAL